MAFRELASCACPAQLVWEGMMKRPRPRPDIDGKPSDRRTGSRAHSERLWRHVALGCGLLWLAVATPAASGKDRPQDPYKGQSGAKPQVARSRQKALFTTQKKKPDRAERRAVLEDYRIPRHQWKDYVVEYRVPVTMGGSNAYVNIEALPKHQARIKRRVQKELETKLRREEISLEEAQQRILNWSQEPGAGSKDELGRAP